MHSLTHSAGHIQNAVWHSSIYNKSFSSSINHTHTHTAHTHRAHTLSTHTHTHSRNLHISYTQLSLFFWPRTMHTHTHTALSQGFQLSYSPSSPNRLRHCACCLLCLLPLLVVGFCELVSKRFMFQLCATCAQQWRRFALPAACCLPC